MVYSCTKDFQVQRIYFKDLSFYLSSFHVSLIYGYNWLAMRSVSLLTIVILCYETGTEEFNRYTAY